MSFSRCFGSSASYISPYAVITDTGIGISGFFKKAHFPGVKREISDLSKKASLNLSDKGRDILFNDIDRPRSLEGENGIILSPGDEIVFIHNTPQKINWESLKTYRP